MQLMPRFNLIEEPWIPVREGETLREVGIREALLNAHSFDRIEDPSPLVEIALLRVLLAVLHRALEGPKNRGELFSLLMPGKLPGKPIENYLSRFYERFWLIHDKAPFWQVPDLPLGKNPTPVGKLKPTQATGDNPTLFDHSFDDDQSPLSFSGAARLLCAHQTFDPGGTLSGNREFFKVTSGKDAPLARAAVFVPYGKNLFATLLFLMPPYRKDMDRPFWEEPPLHPTDLIAASDGAPKKRLPFNGRTRVYTWYSRGIRLLAEKDQVCHIAYGPGVHPIDPEHYHDPFTSIEIDSKRRALKVVKLAKDRSFWRDFHTLIPEPGQGAPALVLDTARALIAKNEHRRHRPLSLLVTGQVTKPGQKKILEIRREYFPLPTRAPLRKLGLYIRNSLAMVKSGANCLNSALRKTAKALTAVSNTTGSKELNDMIESFHATDYYYHHLGVLFPYFLENLQLHPDSALREWQDNVLRAIRKAWKHARDQVGNKPRTLAALQKGESALAACLRKEKKNE